MMVSLEDVAVSSENTVMNEEVEKTMFSKRLMDNGFNNHRSYQMGNCKDLGLLVRLVVLDGRRLISDEHG